MSEPGIANVTESAAFSHVGICVADLERSLAFYGEGLGLVEVARHEVGPEFGPLMELPGVELTSVMMSAPGLVIELLGFRTPTPIGPSDRRPMHQFGLTHLSFRVADLEATLERLRVLGGREVPGTRTPLAMGSVTLDFVYLTDPDGTRIELMYLPAA